MSISLYQAVIPSYLQIVEAMIGLLDKAEEHCDARGMEHSELIEAGLAEDMWPFAKQINSVRHHSIGAIEGMRAGLFQPPVPDVPSDFDGLRQLLSDAKTDLEALTENEIEAFTGKTVRFQAGDYKINFIAEDFLLSFSQPNFYFHASTSYAILRHKGVAIGKGNFLGQFRKIPQ